MRKSLFMNVMAIMMIVVLVLSGCTKSGSNDVKETQEAVSETPSGAQTDTPTETTAAQENQDPVTIRILTWDDTYKELFSKFSQKYPWITIESVFPTGSIIETAIAAEAAGTPIDVIWMDELAPFVKDDMLADLKPYMDNDETLKTKKFADGFLETFEIGGKRYASPFTYVSTWVVVNKDILKKNGMEMPANDWSLDDFRAMAKKATNSADGDFGVAYNPSLIAMYFLSAVSAANGHAANLEFMNADLTQSLLNTPAVLEDVKWLKEFVTKDGSIASDQKAAELGLNAANDFLAGKSLFDVVGDWVLPTLQKDAKFNWDILPFPKGKVQQNTFGMVGAFGIASASKHKDAAYKWISYQFELEAQKWKIDRGSNASVMDDEVVAYYNETPMWKGKNIDAVVDTFKFACCVSNAHKIPASAENPWTAVMQVVFGPNEPESLIPLAEAWNKKTLEVRQGLGW
ncbi:extracellular solute-binding protein [Paenibacillus eucommiae]|uniref:ABC-type glycerol-3-phosphate transport system substrate-binding protein n=1 Tax=Paenibacillus eucommiae TaxID=1355755 RepID=A0ABS4IZV5_9BACL|nr:extracellular solute-binding protein [Paenibacillus eucommiae]MBP1993114.1 ABC-type glycerol-3-phosphate transport system substrate-binding protein [Paenibacillus eucommiae]